MWLSAILGSQMLNVCLYIMLKKQLQSDKSNILKYELTKKYEILLQQKETAFDFLQVFGLKAHRSVFAEITCSFKGCFQREQKLFPSNKLKWMTFLPLNVQGKKLLLFHRQNFTVHSAPCIETHKFAASSLSQSEVEAALQTCMNEGQNFSQIP